MGSHETTLHLDPGMFTRAERVLVESEGPDRALSASAFRFESGVCGLRLTSRLGELVMLPYQGQQVWSATFNGRNLTMQSMFDQPYPTRDFLRTFGGFLQHCGITGVGGPGPEDDHPLHGELPNAPYEEAYVLVGEDDSGPYIGLGGRYRYTVAFGHHYAATPRVTLHAGSTRFDVAMTITNLKRATQEMLYLAHVNFRPIDHARLVYSAPAENVRVRASIPDHIKPGPGYAEFLQALSEDPAKHHVLAPGMAYDPEGVFFIDYLADGDGWAHSMQVHPDGTADYLAHHTDPLNHATRWISRTPDQDAIALVEAGTAEPEGYHAEKAKGNVKVLAPGESVTMRLRIGSLAPDEAEAMKAHIQDIVASAK
jgi:hypothetical protein